MSRTYKDKHWKLRFRDWHAGYDGRLKIAGYWPKVKKEIDTEYHWMSGTPSWWTNLFMNRPIRRKFQSWERNCEKSSISDLEDTFEPNSGKKPHKYYY